MEKDVVRSGHGLVGGTIQALAYRNRKPRETSDKTADVPVDTLFLTVQILRSLYWMRRTACLTSKIHDLDSLDYYLVVHEGASIRTKHQRQICAADIRNNPHILEPRQ
jgi:hypothetical protein